MKSLQQQLLRDDCYLPEIVSEDEKDLARRAEISASDEIEGYPASKVTSGVSRRLGKDSGAWRATIADTPWIRLDLPARAALKTLQITLDSNFDLEKKITLSSRRQNQQVPGIPKELIRDYDVELLLGGKIVETIEVRDNFQRLNRIDLCGTTCDAVRIRVRATNGDEYARIFEIRLYEA